MLPTPKKQLKPGSGEYRYLLNGAPTEIFESFAIESGPDAQLNISGVRRAPGFELSACASLRDGTVHNCELVWTLNEQPPLWCSYELADKELKVQRRSGDAVAEVRHLTLAQSGSSLRSPLLSPLMRIFAGPVIASILTRGGSAEVIVPFIAEPENTERLLWPVISDRSARVLSEHEELVIDDNMYKARRCEYLGDQYAPGTQFWLGMDDRLLRYCWQQPAVGEWDVLLIE